MTLSCQSLHSKDQIAEQLCQQITTGLRSQPDTLDRGEGRVDYRASGAMPISNGANSALEPVEIYQAYLDVTLPQPHAAIARSLFNQRFGVDVPWKLDASHDAVVARLISAVEAEAAKYIAAHAGSDPAFVRANTLLSFMRRPKDQGGLALRYENHLLAETNINRTIDRGVLRCSEFQRLYWTIAKRMGLSAFPIEIPQVDLAGNEAPHAAVMVVNEKTNARYFADMEFADVQTTSPYSKYFIYTPADVFAGYLYNMSMATVEDTSTHDKHREISSAANIPLRKVDFIAPHNAAALVGLGAHYFAKNDGEKSLAYFQRANGLRSDMPSAIAAQCWLELDLECKAMRPVNTSIGGRASP